MLNDKSLALVSSPAGAIQRYRHSKSYTQLQTTIIALAFTTLTAVTLPAFILVQPTYARESIMAIQRSIKNAAKTSSSSVDTLTEELADLEIARGMLDAKLTSDAGAIHKIENKIHSLRDKITKARENHAHVNRLVADAIKAKVVKLEIDVALLSAMYITEYPEVQIVEAQIRSLRLRHSQLQPRNSQVVLNEAIMRSLQTEIAELKVAKNRLSQQYTPQNPVVQYTDTQVHSLQKRLAMYQN
ncbi:hypothetical protein [Calothrix sp. UHCC 0171]|uniref:hypothetical protein n=1 Tax=Calothrix sp. UHCC 0171 TaxID=3110245 RepID=UPI002B20C5D1|nr:hypothetical protein [Calothrix sp. UHCC 0171]MEA5571723.1 hypothetical protein [Calothrix sp. UHCC 0171]